MGLLDIFNPSKDEEKDCLVMNDGGAVVSGLMGETEATAFAAKVVAGRMPQLAGCFTCYVVRVTPIKRMRDKEVSNVVEEVFAARPLPSRDDWQADSKEHQSS